LFFIHFASVQSPQNFLFLTVRAKDRKKKGSNDSSIFESPIHLEDSDLTCEEKNTLFHPGTNKKRQRFVLRFCVCECVCVFFCASLVTGKESVSGGRWGGTRLIRLVADLNSSYRPTRRKEEEEKSTVGGQTKCLSERRSSSADPCSSSQPACMGAA